MRRLMGMKKKFGNMRFFSILILLIVLALSLVACNSQTSGSTEKESSSSTKESASKFKERDKVIGYSVMDLKQPFWQSFQKGIEDAAKEAGYEVVVSDQKGSQETQVSGSMNLINKNISALIVTPTQPSALPATINAAHNVKIPVVIGDIGVEGDYDAYVLSDNEGGGALAAEYINELLGSTEGKKQVGIIELHPGNVVGADRVRGFVEKLKEFNGFEVVSKLNGDDSVDGGFKATQSMLAANPNIKVIFAANDPEAEGAVQALKQAGRLEGDKRVEVIGFNGDANALELVKNGEMLATIAQHPIDMGKKSVEIALKLLNGEKIDFSTPDKKEFNVPTTLVDSKNIEEFLK
ncbi:substrate-binding domain-containing protein [Neobacillus muris]|uniref:substrate-binding domain-containing protein n=1 Tax=Neobacillus muris TaxID=2941334 RepID=UPI0020418E0F|nr:substrate-binding domain-containing protein [Neobacillus muris]